MKKLKIVAEILFILSVLYGTTGYAQQITGKYTSPAFDGGHGSFTIDDLGKIIPQLKLNKTISADGNVNHGSYMQALSLMNVYNKDTKQIPNEYKRAVILKEQRIISGDIYSWQALAVLADGTIVFLKASPGAGEKVDMILDSGIYFAFNNKDNDYTINATVSVNKKEYKNKDIILLELITEW